MKLFWHYYQVRLLITIVLCTLIVLFGEGRKLGSCILVVVFLLLGAAFQTQAQRKKEAQCRLQLDSKIKQDQISK